MTVKDIARTQQEWIEDILQYLKGAKDEFFIETAEARLKYYHRVGEILNDAFEDTERAKRYGKRLMEKAKELLKLNNVQYLYDARKFAQMYPQIPVEVKNWTQARQLVGAKGDIKVLSHKCQHKKAITREVRWCPECKSVIK